MADGKALVYSYLLDGSVGGKELDWPEIDAWESYLKMLCFRIISPSELNGNLNERQLGLSEEISLIRTLPK